MSLSKPPITITTTDSARLYELVDRWAKRNMPVADLLAAELDRAKLVEPTAIPPNIVTMHSRAAFRFGGKEIEATLVYPGEEDVTNGCISISTPVGAALLGLAAGQTIGVLRGDDTHLDLEVLRVAYQPEADGRYDR